MMAFDECIPYPATQKYTKTSMDRTHRWLDRCVKSWTNPKQSLFGIIQGSTYKNLREECAKEVIKETYLELPLEAFPLEKALN